MGQKVNPIAYRLGISKNDWDFKYNEKNITESSNYFIKLFLIKKYIKQFLYINKILLHQCDIAFSSSNIQLNLSYSILTSFPFIKNFNALKKSNKAIIQKKGNLYIYIKQIFKNLFNIISKLKNFYFYDIKNKIKKKIKIKQQFLTKLIFLKKIIVELISIKYYNNKNNKLFQQKKKYISLFKKIKKKSKTGYFPITKHYLLKCNKNLKNLKKKHTTTKLDNLMYKHFLYHKKIKKKYYIIKRRKKKYNNHFNFITYYKSFKKNKKKKINLLKSIKENFSSLLLFNTNNKYNLNKNIFYLKKYKTIQHFQTNNFIKYFLKILKTYIGKKRSIYLTLHQINSIKYTDTPLHLFQNSIDKIFKKNSNNSTKFFNNFFRLNRYKNYHFFETTLNTILLTMTKKNSAAFLANFIAKTLPRIGIGVRHKFFLKFIEKIITLFINFKNFSKIKGIQITTRGRVNQVSKKKIFTISIGKISKQKIDLKINHAKATAQTRANGTLGIEVWINYTGEGKEYNFLFLCFYNQKNHNFIKN